MMGSPTILEQKQLDELGIKIKEELWVILQKKWLIIMQINY
jgi:hypothetical protein